MLSVRASSYLLHALLLFLLCQPSPFSSAQSSNRYKNWLDQDVRWIIAPQERADYLKLSTDQQRDQFVMAFWERRNPTPGASENPFKQEHYRRIAFANQHFAAKQPGWKTDRGRIYIVYGAPDRIDSRPSGQYRLASGVRASTDPYEVWYYQSIAGIGEDISVRFVDTCRCGDYRQKGDPDDRHQLPAPAPSEN